ncbi:Dynein heavy chain 2, axonemal [Cricetulus griseus]|uniref:Dynein heavy chain 2, axonemal n=1 Tax=Cricetulus griseus TaxID=10029 RepID=G3GY66_CRIGR|nr:Dynein heavy chain 2, axonemal [Cricetulus griseus]
MLTGLEDSVWTEEHTAVLERFVQDPTQPALTIFVDPIFGLKLELGMPVQAQTQIVYFIRQAPVPITLENFEATVQFGTMRGAYIPALLRLLSGVYVPQIFMNSTWPESIRNHFVSHLHRFLACLTEDVSSMKVPETVTSAVRQGLTCPQTVEIRDQPARVGSPLQPWGAEAGTGVVRLSGKYLHPLSHLTCPLKFFTNYVCIECALLTASPKQHHTCLCRKTSSWSARKCCSPSDGSRQAQSNLTFLSILREPYQELAFMKPKDISDKLPKLISLIRIIWVNSPHYNTRERLTSLFRKVCECQYHFARWEDGKQGPLPCFFGAQGPQITRNLLEIEDIFHKNLQTLRAVRGGILDVKNTSWHEDYNKFRAGIKDLEVMTQNLITSAFELVRDVEHGVLLLDTFHRLATREAIMRTYEKKAVDLYMLFNSELALVNRELNKKWPYLEPYMAQYSGQAHWMRILRRRIDRVMNCLSGAHFLPHIGTGEESVHTYQQMVQTIDEMVRKTFQEWTATLDKDCIRRLDTPLLRISQEKAGMLDVNFDKYSTFPVVSVILGYQRCP